MNLQGKTVNVLGDSITHGHGVSSPEHTYAAVMGRIVGAKEIRNFGVCGTRIAKRHEVYGEPFTVRYKDMPDDADLVLVFGGTNDYGQAAVPFGQLTDTTDDTFCGACHVLFRGLIEKYPSTPIVILTPLQRTGCTRASDRGPEGRPLIEYVDAIMAIAAMYSLPVLDLYRTAGIAADMPIQQKLYMPDGLHLNDEGARRVGARLAAFLTAL